MEGNLTATVHVDGNLYYVTGERNGGGYVWTNVWGQRTVEVKVMEIRKWFRFLAWANGWTNLLCTLTCSEE